MSTWRIAREAGASSPGRERPAISRGRGGAPESPGTSRETSRTTSWRLRTRLSGSRAPIGLHRLVERTSKGLDLRLERVDPIEHLLDRLGQGIGQIRVLEIQARRDL